MQETETAQGQDLLRITNHHIDSCGTPPFFNDPKGYVSYFTNLCGEQFILHYTPQTREAMLFLGEAGWDHPYPVSRIHVSGNHLEDLVVAVGDSSLKTPMVEGLLLTTAERLWIFSCLLEWLYVSSLALAL